MRVPGAPLPIASIPQAVGCDPEGGIPVLHLAFLGPHTSISSAHVLGHFPRQGGTGLRGVGHRESFVEARRDDLVPSSRPLDLFFLFLGGFLPISLGWNEGGTVQRCIGGLGCIHGPTCHFPLLYHLHMFVLLCPSTLVLFGFGVRRVSCPSSTR